MVAPDTKFVEELNAAGGENAKMCFQCGTCTASCPSGRTTSYRTRKLIRMAQLGLKDDIVKSDDLWQCTTCYTCEERCPRGVPIVDVVIALRNIAVKNGKMFENHKKTASALIQYGHSVSENDKITELRKSLGLPAQPPTVLADKKAKADFDTLLKETGFKKLVKE